MSVPRPLLVVAFGACVLSAFRPNVRAQSGPPTTIVAISDAAIRVWDGAVDQMSRSGELQIRPTEPDNLLPGRAHEHLDQYYQGVSVIGGGVTRQSVNGFTTSIFGTIYPVTDLDVTPRLTANDALATIQRLSGVELGPSRLPPLTILPENDRTYRLIYRASVFTFSANALNEVTVLP